ncbi:hypothetical protein ABDD95_19440 [Mucilaginibacter sp. PAMB04274]|uniref:hypothetical protein n=1 Tax=Mucilaginibacter sp. PAMB04274 TaxID=3138568 RepID=UPI0031F6C52D
MKGQQVKSPILHTAISELELSTDFKDCCQKMGFRTLQDIISTGWVSLTKYEHFNYRWFGELLKFLEANYLLLDMPPKPDTFH